VGDSRRWGPIVGRNTRKHTEIGFLAALGLLGAMGIGSTAHASEVTPDSAANLIIRNARVFDGEKLELSPPTTVGIAGNRFAWIGSEAAAAVRPDAQVIDAGGRVVTPGLIDAHWHAMIIANFEALKSLDANYVAIRAASEAKNTLMRGFTTVRDPGGPSFGLKRAIDEGVVAGPRIFPSGAIVSQTGGHGDFRSRLQRPKLLGGEPDVLETLGYTVSTDGPDQILAAVREQLRLGATQIKLAAGGGISTPENPLDSVQLFDEEMRASVRAAGDFGTYVTVHAYTPAAIRRAVEAGVRCVEHAHLVDEPTMKMIAARGVFVSIQAYAFSGALGGPASGPNPPTATQLSQRAKMETVQAGLDRAMQLAKRYRARVAFGTDLFGSARAMALQPKEFGARLRWFSSGEVLAQATRVNGELLALSGPRDPYGGRLGVIETGALADLLIVDGNPLDDVRVLENPEANLRVIVKDGAIYKNTLAQGVVR
jgi:imidazolonepropionase-like amidohydrolase